MSCSVDDIRRWSLTEAPVVDAVQDIKGSWTHANVDRDKPTPHHLHDGVPSLLIHDVDPEGILALI